MKAEARQLSRGVVDEFAKYDLLTYSSAIAFQVLYAVVPLALLALAGLSLAGERSVYTDHVAPTLQHHLSRDAFRIANRTATKVMASRALFWGTIGFLIALWGVGASLRAMMTPLNTTYGSRETRSWLRRLLVSLAGGFAVVVCVFAAAAAVLGGRLLHLHGVAAVGVFLGRWLAALTFLLAAIAVILRAVPAKKRPFRWITVGSLLSAACWIAATVGFGAYISAVSYSSFYGGLGSVILLLVYLHVAAIAFLLGVTVDAVLQKEETRKHRRGRGRTRAGR